MKRISLALLFTFALLGFMKGENLSVTTETVYFSYKQNIQIGIDDERLHLPGSTEAFPGYVVCGIEQTDADWENYYFSTTFKHYLLPAEDKDKIEYLYSDTEYSVGDKIDGRTILARSVAFNLLFSPSENSIAMQANNFFHYSPQGMVNTTGDFYNYSNGDSDPKVHVDGAYIYKYCVEKLTYYCKIAEGEYLFVQGSRTMYDAGGGAFTRSDVNYSTATDEHLWIVAEAGNGGYYIRNKATGLYLTSNTSTLSSRSLATKETPEEFFFTVYKSDYSKKANYWIQSQNMIDRNVAMDAAGNNNEVICWTKGNDGNTSNWKLLPTFGWEYDSDSKTLYINSDAVMLDYENIQIRPWNDIAPEVDEVVFSTGITYIGTNTFKEFYSLNNITIPETVTSVGNYAFYKCRSLTSIEIPNRVTNIGNYAFNGCRSLAGITVDENNPVYNSRENCNAIIETASNTLIQGCRNTVIPGSVTTIGDNAFNDCGLTSITIPGSVTTIKEDAFVGCIGLTSIMVDDSNPIYDSRDNCNAIIETASNTLVAGCKNTVIPGSVTTIGTDAFIKNDLASITIPNSVTAIEDYAFYGCNSLTSIIIPNNSVTTIGFGAFSGCTSLASITIPNSVTTIENEAFKGCIGLTSITVDNNNTIYDSRNNCNAIIEKASNTLVAGCKNTVIPENVTTIGVCAFDDCYSLTSIRIPRSVTSIRNYAFDDCTGLTSIISLIPADQLFVPASSAFNNVPTSCTLYVPAGAKETYAATGGWNKFENIVELNFTYDNITYEVIPGTENVRVKSVNQSATSVNIPATVTDDDITYNVTEIGSSAFSGCTSLSDIKIEGFYENLTASMFNYTVPYREADNNSTPLYIDKYFFGIVDYNYGFSGDMNIAAGTKYIMSIGSYCSIRKLNIPASVEYIKYDGVKGGRYDSCYECEDYHWVSYPTGYNVDAGNSNFSSIDGVLYNKQQTELLQCAYGQEAAIVIPSTVEKIRSNALATSSILPIECLATTPPVCESSLRLNSMQKVYVPQESIDSYLAADYWKECYLQPSLSAYSDEVKLYGQTLSDWRVTETSYDVVSKTYNIDALKGEKLSFTFNIDTYDAYFKVYVDNVHRYETWEREATGVFEHIFTSSGAHTLRLEYKAVDSYMEDKISVTNLTVARAAYKRVNISFEDWTSDVITHNQTSQKRYTFNADAGSTITFDWTTSTEGSYDFLTCVLDNSTILTRSGVNNGTYTGTISTGGSHTLVCTYSKDGSVNGGTDQVSVKNIKVNKSIGDYNHIDSFVLSEIENNNIVRFSDLSVDEIVYRRNFTNTNWQALYLPIEIPYEALAEEFEVAYPNDIHQYDDDEDGVIDRTELEIIRIKRGTLSADYPYLIRAKEAGVKEICIDDATLYLGEENSYDCSSMHTQYIFTGTYSGVPGSELVSNRYYALSSGALSYTTNPEARLSPYRWYLKIVSRNGAAQPQRISLVMDGETTDIDEVECDEDTNVYYDLSGRRIEQPTKGIYIVNGKKVLVK